MRLMKVRITLMISKEISLQAASTWPSVKMNLGGCDRMEGMTWKWQQNVRDKPTILERDTSRVAERSVLLLDVTQI